MKAITSRFFASSLLLAVVVAAVPATAAEPDLAAAEAATARNDRDAVIKLLLPAFNRGELKDGRALYLLGNACFYQKHQLKFAFNKAAQCNSRSGRIMWAAADSGNVDALLDMAYTLDTKLVPMRHPDLPQDRTKAFHAALMARKLAKTDDQRERADKVLAEIGDRLNPAARQAVTANVAAFLKAHGMDANIDDDTGPADKTGKLAWLDAASLNLPQHYHPSVNKVKVGEDSIEQEGDAGIADEIDTDSIMRHGEAVQYVFSGMDTVTLIQARCDGGAPSLIWEADPYEAEADGSLTFHPQAKQPIPQWRNWIDYYATLTRKACSL